MFIIKTNYNETFEVKADIDKVRDFFANIRNFIDLMPGIEDIHTDNKDTKHWKIRADIPFIGSFTEKFVVEETENNDERVEWSPAKGEKYNLMKYAADFMPKGKDKTLVQFSQMVELRRNSAMDLHLLAGLAGESLISSEMNKRITEMLINFIREARKRIEKE